jgi:hypothetical protein
MSKTVCSRSKPENNLDQPLTAERRVPLLRGNPLTWGPRGNKVVKKPAAANGKIENVCQ